MVLPSLELQRSEEQLWDHAEAEPPPKLLLLAETDELQPRLTDTRPPGKNHPIYIDMITTLRTVIINGTPRLTIILLRPSVALFIVAAFFDFGWCWIADTRVIFFAFARVASQCWEESNKFIAIFERSK